MFVLLTFWTLTLSPTINPCGSSVVAVTVCAPFETPPTVAFEIIFSFLKYVGGVVSEIVYVLSNEIVLIPTVLVSCNTNPACGGLAFVNSFGIT